MTEDSLSKGQSEAHPLWRRPELLIVLVYAMLVAYSFLRIPIPGVNEPHYLCKAKHFWNSDWCSNDPFLSSSNPHLVFYWTFGWLTRFFDLQTTAVIARSIGLLPVSIGWTMLIRRVSGIGWSAPLSVGVFLVLQSAGNWSGEWLIGGIESKVISYGFLLWAIAEAMALRVPLSAFLAGVAISFHPVVGVWGTVATAMATGMMLLTSDRKIIRDGCPPFKTWMISAGLFFLTAAPGLVSAGAAVFEGDPEESRAATVLQVGYRLAHHLDPMAFPKEAYRYFAILILVWAYSVKDSLKDLISRWWALLVVSSLLIAIVGVAMGWGPRPIKEMPGYEWRMTALKFYPFRLADVFVPLSLSLALSTHLSRWWSMKNWGRWRDNFMRAILIPMLFLLAVAIPGTDQNPSRMSPDKRANWIATCDWIEQNSSRDDMIYSFDNQWAVKWFANRAEYVNYKDCPQDAKSIIEWNRRRWVISLWQKRAFADGRASIDELKLLSEKTGVRYFICDRTGPFELAPSYRNEDFRVYRVE